MKKLLSLLCLAALVCVIGCSGGVKPTGDTTKGGTGGSSPSGTKP
jgi:hypothetical protein